MSSSSTIAVKQDLTQWPSDLLSHVVSLLDLEDIIILKAVNKSLRQRLIKEPILLSLRLTKPPDSSSPALAFGDHLRRLCIRINEEVYHEYMSRSDWLLHLPKKLEDIDFAFHRCIIIWLTRVPFGNAPWYIRAENQQYAPIDVGKLLPNLQRLRLEGTFDIPFPAPTGKIHWTMPMQCFFIKTLPRALLELAMPLRRHANYIAPFLPPNLTSLVDLSSEIPLIDHRVSTLAQPVASSLHESLTSYSWLFSNADGAFASQITSFKQLESLDLGMF
jgi:hypothetical protein